VIGEVAIATPHGEMPSYVAAPSRPAARPGVVIPDFTGMSHDLRNQPDWLASEGFLAAAPDLYYRGSRPRCLRTIMRGRRQSDRDGARRLHCSHRRDGGVCQDRIGSLAPPAAVETSSEAGAVA
jgi:dienelactone hydrolase